MSVITATRPLRHIRSAPQRRQPSTLVPWQEQKTPLALGVDPRRGRVLLRLSDGERGTMRGVVAHADLRGAFKRHSERCRRKKERCWSLPLRLREEVLAWADRHYKEEELVTGREDLEAADWRQRATIARDEGRGS